MSDAADVIVIGMGPGGEDVAGRLAEAGLDVVGIEAALVGGECPYWGCIPSKMMIRAAGLLAEARRIPGVAGTSRVEPDWGPVARRIRDEATDTWDDTVAVDRFVGKGGRFVRGRGTIVAPGRVRVSGPDGDEQEVEARRGIVIATGTSPAVHPIAGLSDTPFWTNRDAIAAESVPDSLIVLGGGAVGLELAQSFSRFDASVTVVEALARLLPLEEPEVGALLAEVFAAEGIGVHTGQPAVEVKGNDDEVTVVLADGTTVAAARLLVATGRKPNLEGLGLGQVGLDEGARFVAVDHRMRAAEGVWAVGDITGEGLFTHVALYQSAIAAADILGEETPGADYSAVSRVTFTDPEVGSVGISEVTAREEGMAVRTFTQNVAHTARGWLHKVGNEGLIKLVEDADRGVLVGATSVGPHGGEVLGLLSLAVHAGVPTAQMRRMIYAYPTFHKGVEDALRGLADAPVT